MGKKEITLTAHPDIKLHYLREIYLREIYLREIYLRDIFLPNVGTFRKSGIDQNFKISQ